MTAGITPEAVAAELDLLDGEAKLVAGNVVVSIGFTNAAVKTLAPREWEDLAAWLLALIAREPIRTSRAFTGHRIVLGALATELRGFAEAAGEPVGLQADLRAATSQADERRINARIADEQAAFDRHIDEVLLANSVQREIAQQSVTPQEETIDQAPVAIPTPETDDALDYL